MKPLVHYNPMTDITEAEQRKLCRCAARCKQFVIITYTRGPVLTMCETETKRYISEVGKAIGIKVKLSKQQKEGWTEQETEKVKQHYEKHGGEWGYLKELAIDLGRTSEQLRQKIWRMKQKGELG